MKSMEAQFKEITKPRINSITQKAGKEVAGLFEEQMKANTQVGTGFGADPYNNDYSQSHRKRRKKLGLQTQNVDLRMKNSRIDQTKVQTTGGKKGVTAISFQSGGDIFQLHHTGNAKGNKIRSIWPKSPESIPKTLTSKVSDIVAEVLRGK